MKKISLFMAAALLLTGIAVHAATLTNEFGQVITTTVSSAGLTTTIVDPNAAMSRTNRTVEALGCQLSMAANTTQTRFTPRNYRDMLVGQEGSTRQGVGRHGSDDQRHEKIYSAQKAVNRLNRLAPQIKTGIIPNAGHDLSFVQAELVTKRILDFLGEPENINR